MEHATGLHCGGKFGVMSALLGIKFLVSKIRNREGCHPLEMK